MRECISTGSPSLSPSATSDVKGVPVDDVDDGNIEDEEVVVCGMVSDDCCMTGTK